MAHKIKIEPDWKYLGSCLAVDGDDEQAKFLKAFVKECNSWGTHAEVEYQLASVNQLLTKDEKETLGMLSYDKEEK